jgi:pimeloyl-ACP methyl ester carboxylesterase
MEPRFTMAAPSCFVTTFRRNAENELPADTEQCPPRVLAEGLDHSDFLAAMAPKPVIVMAQEKDYFDARGSKTTFERLKHLYTLLGHPERVRLHIGPDPHGYTQPNREAMYAFFNEATGVSSAKTEPELAIEPDEKLLCAPEGQVERLGSRTLMSFTREIAAKTKPPAKPLAARIREALRLPEEIAVPDYRIPRPLGGRDYPSKSSVTYAVETEPGIHALVTRLTPESHYSRIPAGHKRAILYIAHHSADAELRDDPLIAGLIKAGPEAAFFACDVRGIGESRPNTCGADTFLSHYGSDYFYAAHGVMLGRPVLGQRTLDVLAVLELLDATGHEHIHLAGRGWGALPAALAAVLSPHVAQVTLKNHLTSWRDVVADDDYRWPCALLPFGVLHHLDLPEVYAALKVKHLQAIEPWGSLAG